MRTFMCGCVYTHPGLSPGPSLPGGPAASLCSQGDNKMLEILRYTHQFLQKFCAGNPGNQALLHKHLQLFLTPGVRRWAGP